MAINTLVGLQPHPQRWWRWSSPSHQLSTGAPWAAAGEPERATYAEPQPQTLSEKPSQCLHPGTAARPWLAQAALVTESAFTVGSVAASVHGPGPGPASLRLPSPQLLPIGLSL